jgi:hypothetical protein
MMKLAQQSGRLRPRCATLLSRGFSKTKNEQKGTMKLTATVFAIIVAMLPTLAQEPDYSTLVMTFSILEVYNKQCAKLNSAQWVFYNKLVVAPAQDRAIAVNLMKDK